MNFIVQIFIGGLTGWFAGKLFDSEGRGKVVPKGHGRDTIYGILGGIFGKYLFSWVVIGKGDLFSDCAMAILGAITVVGAAKLLAKRWRQAGS